MKKSRIEEALEGSYLRYICSDFLATEFFDRTVPIVIEVKDGCDVAAVKAKIKDMAGDVTLVCEGRDGECEKPIDTLDGSERRIALMPAPLTELKRFGLADFVRIMRRLRADDGCEWDRAQTHESIRINLIEEAYELVEAIDMKNAAMIQEECGDVLMQAVFHALIAEKEGEFDFYDMVTELSRKLIDRHTHIFGQNHADTPEQALEFWTAAKKKEKKYASTADAMDRVPKNLPSLLYAEKVQKLAKKSGFDWQDASGAEDKLKEELAELRAADEAHRTEEGGDLLFAAVNVLRFYHVEPEMALKEASKKFLRRFEGVEKAVAEQGKQMSDLSLSELDKIWDKVKSEEQNR